MAHFAKLNENGVVLEVVVVTNNDAPDEASGIAFLTNLFGKGIVWKQTSYNGKMRKNYAGIGYTFDAARDAFIAPSPFSSWVLNEQSCQWEAPVPMPTDGKRYAWNEELKAWDVQLAN